MCKPNNSQNAIWKIDVEVIANDCRKFLVIFTFAFPMVGPIIFLNIWLSNNHRVQTNQPST